MPGNNGPRWMISMSITRVAPRSERVVPRSTEPTALRHRYLKSICHRLNTTPRKCLGFRTPAEVFKRKLMEIQNRLE